MTEQRWRAAVAGAVGVVAIAGCAAGGETSSDGRSAASTSATQDESQENVESRYQDGAYSADGWYGSLPSSIGVELTLEDDVITDVGVTTHATDPTSLDYQQRFADAVPEVVIGRPIDEVRVSELAGSSGTPDGFNDALDRIKNEASR
jgi:uncharacterized protein with FMN-binding domain